MLLNRESTLHPWHEMTIVWQINENLFKSNNLLEAWSDYSIVIPLEFGCGFHCFIRLVLGVDFVFSIIFLLSFKLLKSWWNFLISLRLYFLHLYNIGGLLCSLFVQIGSYLCKLIEKNNPEIVASYSLCPVVIENTGNVSKM